MCCRGVEDTTPAGVLAAAQRHLHPGKQVVVLVADQVATRGDLREAGVEVTQTLQLSSL